MVACDYYLVFEVLIHEPISKFLNFLAGASDCKVPWMDKDVALQLFFDIVMEGVSIWDAANFYRILRLHLDSLFKLQSIVIGYLNNW